MKHTEPLTRTQIALWNSAIVILVLAFANYTAHFLYPGVFHAAAGISRLMLITGLVASVLGPVLVAYLWVPGKKGLWLDMAVMGLLQVTLWVSCFWVLYSQRPVWLVFAQDRFIVLRDGDIDIQQLPEGIPAHPRPGHPQLVIASQPEDRALREQIMFAAAGGGADIERYAQLWSLASHAALQQIEQVQAQPTSYYGAQDSIAGELLLIGTRHDLLVHWDSTSQAITKWRHEPAVTD